MAYRKDKTTVAQTAANNAATVVSALVTAGLITDIEVAKTEYAAIQASGFAVLAPIVEADNAVFAEAEAAAPKAAPKSNGGGGKSNGAAPTLEQSLALDLSFGKFKGVTLAELQAMTKSECEAYGYTSGNGVKYLEYLAKNENNPYVAARASVILDARKASSDEG